jgi:integrase
MNGPIKYLGQEQVTEFFLKITSKRDRALFNVIYKYGLRASEATLLEPAHVDLRRGRIYIPRLKNGISGEKPLLRDVKRVLKAYMEGRLPTGEGLFTGREGTVGYKRISQLFKQYAKKAKIRPEFSIHCLRHSIAVHLLEAGHGVEFVQDHLGHVNIQNTMVYARVTDRQRKEGFRRMELATEIVKV